MSIAEILLPEFDREMALTRRLLERVPMDRASWRPHAKSMTLGRLASHVAENTEWAVTGCTRDEIDVAPPGAPPPQFRTCESVEELLAVFDRHVRDGRAAIAAMTDEAFARPWALKARGVVRLTVSRADVVRTWGLNHTIHHRGQLTVYLRLNDVPLPGIYGPSADGAGG
jgi:uncharacterized damage-inducible protein DinB